MKTFTEADKQFMAPAIAEATGLPFEGPRPEFFFSATVGEIAMGVLTCGMSHVCPLSDHAELNMVVANEKADPRFYLLGRFWWN